MTKKNDDSNLFDFSTLHPEVKHLQDDGSNDDHLFDFSSPHPELAGRSLASVAQQQEAPMPPPEVGAGRAALVGAGQGATFGFGEELTAPVVAAAAMSHDAFASPENQQVPTLPGGESTWEKYQRLMQAYRDVARSEQQGAQEQHPLAYTGGAIAGGALSAPLLPLPGPSAAVSTLGQSAVRAGANANAVRALALPAKMAIGGAEGLGLGGVAGLGESEGSLQERLPQAIETAKTGAKIGTALPVIGAGLSTAGKAISKIGDIPVVQDVTKAFQRGAEGQNLITKAGRQEAADVVRGKSGQLYEDIKDLQNEVGSKIQDQIDMAQEAGEKVDLTDDVSAVLDKLQKIKAEGSQEAASYAAGVENEIKKLLKIKSPQEGFMGVPSEALPEGLVVPKAAPTDLKVDPKVAQDLKQVLNDYVPKVGTKAQERAPARVAKELKDVASEKLSSLTEQLPELNEQYGIIKDTLKRLTVNEKQLPEQITQKINNVVTKLEKQNTSGDNARQMIEDVLENLRKVGSEEGGNGTGAALADKYQGEFKDIVDRLDLADKIMKGGESFSLTGTPKAATMAASNIAGLAANKLQANKLVPVAEKTASFAKAVLSNSPVSNLAIKEETQGAGSLQQIRKATEPYKLQRQVASAAENADPDVLKDQAQNIRSKYGEQGERLATMMDNMAGENKDARRALMFTILQNQAYRRMLGLMEASNE